ncbi:MAG: hypothetical protein AAF533_28400 [Acidobacteriota bacterium]
MDSLRPCLQCNHVNPADASVCSQCGAPLTAFASTGGTTKAAVEQVGRALRRGVLLGLVLLILGLVGLGLWLVVQGREQRAASVVTWRTPSTIESWAKDQFRERNVNTGVQARVVETGESERRVLRAVLNEGEDQQTAFLAAAEILLLARRQGEPTLTHLAVLESGPADDRRRRSLPLGEAARVVAEAKRDGVSLTRRVEEPPQVPGEIRVDDEDDAETNDDAAPPAGGEDEVETTPTSTRPSADSRPAARDRAPGTNPRERARPQRRGTTDRGERAQAQRSLRPVRVTGPPVRARKNIDPADGPFPHLRVAIAPQVGRALILRELSLTLTGDSPTKLIDYLQLIIDVNNDGKRDENDRSLGQLGRPEENRVVFEGLDESFGSDRKPLTLLVMTHPKAKATGNMMLSVASMDDLHVEEVESSRRLPASGLPLNGRSVRLGSR